MRVTTELPLKIESVANLRENWRARSRRTRVHRAAAHYQLRVAGVRPPAGMLVQVQLVRIAPRPLDDDNLASGFKAVRDGVADWLGRDDGSRDVRWSYSQERGQPHAYSCRIEVDYA